MSVLDRLRFPPGFGFQVNPSMDALDIWWGDHNLRSMVRISMSSLIESDAPQAILDRACERLSRRAGPWRVWDSTTLRVMPAPVASTREPPRVLAPPWMDPGQYQRRIEIEVPG